MRSGVGPWWACCSMRKCTRPERAPVQAPKSGERRRNCSGSSRAIFFLKDMYITHNIMEAIGEPGIAIHLEYRTMGEDLRVVVVFKVVAAIMASIAYLLVR